MIYVAFDGLFSHCGGQNSNKNPLKQLNIALLKQIFGWRNIWLLFGIFGEISLQSSGHTGPNQNVGPNKGKHTYERL